MNRFWALLGVIVLSWGCPSSPPDPGRSATPPLPAAQTPSPPPRPDGLWFEDGTADSALGLVHHAGRSPKHWMPEISGPGIALADFNRDGAPDVLFADSGSIAAGKRPAHAKNRLLLNDGKGRFVDATATWGVPSVGYGQGVAVGDVNNDGWIDAVFTTWEGTVTLLLNTGTGFTDASAGSGLGEPGWTTSAAFLDADGDGKLDLYLARYADYTKATAMDCYVAGEINYCTPVLYTPLPDRLFRGHGDGTFEDMTEAWGIAGHRVKSLAIAAGDIDLDGDTDLYIAADLSRNLLFINDGTGRMTERARSAGVAYSEVGAEEAGMGADFTDYDSDGLMDITCSNFQEQATAVYRQDAPGFFSERADAIGIGAPSRDRLTFGLDFFDADNDGDEELLMANGHLYVGVGDMRVGHDFEQTNTLFENTGTGRFRDVTAAAGPALQKPAVSRGLATGDLDGDGDLDYLAGNNEGPLQVGRNETRPRGAFLSLWLEGTQTNRSAIGTLVTATVGDRTISAQVMGSQSYLSVSDLRVHLGLGAATRVDSLTIRWPVGAAQTFEGVAVDRFLHLVQGGEPSEYVPGAKPRRP